MASFRSISATSRSIERLLDACFRQQRPVANKTTKALLARTEDFDVATRSPSFTLPALSIFLYRVEVNKTMRAAWSAVGSLDGRAHLPLDLHYLLTPWGDNAEHEHQILGRTMQCLEDTPIIGGPLLHPSGDWETNEVIQLVAEDVTTEALTQAFDSLESDFRLSVSYLARVVRLDGRQTMTTPGVHTAIAGATPELEAVQ